MSIFDSCTTPVSVVDFLRELGCSIEVTAASVSAPPEVKGAAIYLVPRAPCE